MYKLLGCGIDLIAGAIKLTADIVNRQLVHSLGLGDEFSSNMMKNNYN